MDQLSITITVLTSIISTLSITFAILTYARNKGKDSREIETKLARIETDIMYIRGAIEKEERRYESLEKRIRVLEEKI